jgi:hypothetical protein
MQGTRNFPRIFRRIKMGETITTNQKKKETCDWRRTILWQQTGKSHSFTSYLTEEQAAPWARALGEENLSQPESHPREPMSLDAKRFAKAMSSAYDITPLSWARLLDQMPRRRETFASPVRPLTSPHEGKPDIQEIRVAGDYAFAGIRLFEHACIARRSSAVRSFRRLQCWTRAPLGRSAPQRRVAVRAVRMNAWLVEGLSTS